MAFRRWCEGTVDALNAGIEGTAQFPARRGLALAVAQFGIAFIGVLMPQVIGAIIEAYGWRGAYTFFAAAAGVGGLCAQLLMQPAARPDPADPVGGTSPRRAVASAGFRLLSLAVLAISAASFGLVAQFQSVLADRQIGFRATTVLLSSLAGSAMVSHLTVGWLLDRTDPARASAAAGCALLLLLGPNDLTATAAGAVLIGCSIGAELDLMSFFCARLFGIRIYATIYGLLSTFFHTGIAVGGIGYGVIRQGSGGYDGAVLGSTLLLIAAATLFLLLGRQRPVAEKA